MLWWRTVNGLIAAAMVTHADGYAERDAALLMLRRFQRKRRRRRITVGADKAYDTKDFVSTARELNVTPHVAANQRSSLDRRTTRQPGYAVSLSPRWLIEKSFAWLKQTGPLNPEQTCNRDPMQLRTGDTEFQQTPRGGSGDSGVGAPASMSSRSKR